MVHLRKSISAKPINMYCRDSITLWARMVRHELWASVCIFVETLPRPGITTNHPVIIEQKHNIPNYPLLMCGCFERDVLLKETFWRDSLPWCVTMSSLHGRDRERERALFSTLEWAKLKRISWDFSIHLHHKNTHSVSSSWGWRVLWCKERCQPPAW